MPRLLQGRVYRLPTGMRLIGQQSPQKNRFYLLTTSNLTWNPHQGEYAAEPDGRISYMGKPTVWRVSDLLDTGADIPSLAAGA